jgi:imidazoleglycerol-phosphate dehydratase
MRRLRRGSIERATKETRIALDLKLDGAGRFRGHTGLPFLDHMFDHIARHGRLDLTVKAAGDLEVDQHHLVEDLGICLGDALARAIGDKRGLVRYGEAAIPMDEALVQCVLDLSGRPYLAFDLDLRRRKIRGKLGDLDSEVVEEFFRAFATHAGATLHLRQLAGRNTHHIVEAAFKAFARALDGATATDPRVAGVPSTKGSL